MRKKIHLVLALSCCAALAVPAGALAQTPTEDTYSGQAGQQQGEQQAGQQPVAQQQSPSGGDTTTPVQASSAGGTLPFTGFELGLGAIVGVALLGTGVVLRRSVRTSQGA